MFTEFCVVAGVATRTKSGPVDFMYEYDVGYEDRHTHGPHIQSVVYDNDGKEVIVLEGSSSSVKFYGQGAYRVQAVIGCVAIVCVRLCSFACSFACCLRVDGTCMTIDGDSNVD